LLDARISHQGLWVSRQVIYRVQDDPAKAEAMLAKWGM
jgi:hypothetical protein